MTSPLYSHTFSVSLPEWVKDYPPSSLYESEEEKMAYVLELSRLNIVHQTGGPFAAAVFLGNKVVSIGVNRVVPNHCSLAHAEMTALALAQNYYGSFDLGGQGRGVHSLFVNAQPCVMCFGGVLWSGVRELVYAASAKDVEALTGFDEGPLVHDWEEQLLKRGIQVKGGIMKEKAHEILSLYASSGAPIYNGRGGEGTNSKDGK